MYERHITRREIYGVSILSELRKDAKRNQEGHWGTCGNSQRTIDIQALEGSTPLQTQLLNMP